MVIISKQNEGLISEILDNLVKKGMCEAIKHEELFDWYGKIEEEVLDDVQIVFDGATKFVFLFEDVPSCVIKVSRHEMNNNHCRVEAENFRKAQNVGLECYFAPTILFKEIDGVEFYIQERVECNTFGIDSEMYAYAKKVCCSDESTMDKDDFTDLLDEMVYEFDAADSLRAVFGEGYETELLIEFCENNRINDLHAANYGYKNDFPVILDYSGYIG